MHVLATKVIIDRVFILSLLGCYTPAWRAALGQSPVFYVVDDRVRPHEEESKESTWL